MIYISVALIWLLGAALTYNFYIKNYEYTYFEKIWFSLFWPCLAILYPIHYCYNKWFK